MKHLRTAWIVVAVLLLSTAAWADDLRTLSNKSVSGSLEKITDSNITLKDGDKSVDTPLPQVLDLTLRPSKSLPVGKFIEVELLDASVLRCSKVTLGAKDAQLELTSGSTVKVPVAAIFTMLRDADNENIKRQWTKMLAEKKRVDRIFVLKDGDLNPLTGAIGTVDETKQTITFKLESGTTIEPALDKVQGLQFARTELASDPPLCKVIDVDGNTLVASKLAYAGAQVTVTTPYGQKASLDPKTIAKFDFNFGRLTFLSDLDIKMPEVPFLGGFNPVRKDTNLDGNPIILQDKKYEKGLSMYSGVELEYALAGKYKDFKAVLGVDTAIAEEGQGKVTVTIYCDGEKRGNFEVSTKAPIPIAVNVKDVGSMRIVVSGTNFTGFAGHAMLANAHVSQ